MAMALAPSASSVASSNNMEAKEEDEPLVTILPQEVIDALAELDLELSEGKPINVDRCDLWVIAIPTRFFLHWR